MSCKHINKGKVLITQLGGTPILSKYLFEEIINERNLENAYKKASRGKGKYKLEAMKFALNETDNLTKLRNSLIDRSYQFDGYVQFMVYEPKERLIHAPSFKDKIVQLAINDVIKHIYQPSFIHDSYACIDEKGTHKAVDRVSYFMRKASWEYGEIAYIIKLDVRKFFYSIDRGVLKGIICKKIKCKRTLELIFKIVDSADQINPIGLPLGNTLSQIFANVYMNEFDNYCKRKLGIKYYVRYADDAISIVRNKTEAESLLNNMIVFLNSHSKLNVNEKKTKIFPIEQGVNAYGFKIYKTHRLLRNDSKKKIKRKVKKMRRLIVHDLLTIEKAEQILNSWLGHAKNGSSRNFIQSILNKRDYIHLNHKGVLKINTEIIDKERENYALSQRQSLGTMPF